MPAVLKHFIFCSHTHGAVYSNMSEGNRQVEIALNFLRSLDSYRPLFNKKLDLVKRSLDIYRTLSGPQLLPLHKFVSAEDNVRVFFPHCLEEVEVLIQRLKEPAQNGKHYVCLLDVLMLMTIMAEGSLYDKCILFYDWFHFSVYELMSELEMTMFILRFAKCMNKLAVIGRLDIGQADAEHEALKARIDRVDGSLKKGMTLEDFYHWLAARPESLAFENFRLLVGRLMMLLESLRDRTTSILDLLQSKVDYSLLRSDLVPRLDLDKRINNYDNGTSSISQQAEQVQSHCQCVYVLEKTTSSVTVYLPLAVNADYIEHIYIKREEVRPYNYVPRESNMNSDLKLECEQWMSFTSYQHHVVSHGDYSKVGLRIEVTRLLEDKQYVLTFYSGDNVIYGKTEVRTLSVVERPLAPGLGTSPPVSSVECAKVCIFPNSISARKAQDFFHQSSLLSVENTALVLLTGSICSLTEAVPFHNIYPFFASVKTTNAATDSTSHKNGVIDNTTDNMLSDPSNQAALAKSLFSVLDRFCFHNWNDLLYHLFSTVSSPDIVKDGLLPSHSTDCQLGYYPCNSTMHELELLVTKLFPNSVFCDEVNRSKFCSLLKSYVDATYYSYSFPVHSRLDTGYSYGNVKLFVLKQNQQQQFSSCHTSDGGVGAGGGDAKTADRVVADNECGGVSLARLVDEVNSLMMSSSCDHIVITISTPIDLMLEISMDNSIKGSESAVPSTVGEQAGGETGTRGKWEILHGESSSGLNAPVALPAPLQAPGKEPEHTCNGRFGQLLDKLFQWMNTPHQGNRFDGGASSRIGRDSLPSGSRKVTILSCGWLYGHNFVIRRSKNASDLMVDGLSHASTAEIHHECLLPTKLGLRPPPPVIQPPAEPAKKSSPLKGKKKKMKKSVIVDEMDVDYVHHERAAAVMEKLRMCLEEREEVVYGLTEEAPTDCARIFMLMGDCEEASSAATKTGQTQTRTAQTQVQPPRYSMNLVPIITEPVFKPSLSQQEPVAMAKPQPVTETVSSTASSSASGSASSSPKKRGKKIVKEEEERSLDWLTKDDVKAPFVDPFKTMLPVRDAGLHIYRGPRIEQLTSTDVFLSVIARGLGCLECTLYMMPMNISHSNAVAMLNCEERELLRPLGRRRRRCFLRESNQTVVFHFGDLKPYSAFAIIVEPSMNEMPLALYFHTLPMLKIPKSDRLEQELLEAAGGLDSGGGENSSIQLSLDAGEALLAAAAVAEEEEETHALPVTIILAAISTYDLYLPSYKVRRLIKNYGESIRPVAANMYLINSDAMNVSCLGRNKGRHRPVRFTGEDSIPSSVYAACNHTDGDLHTLYLQSQVSIVGRSLADADIKDHLSTADCVKKYHSGDRLLSFKYISVELYASCVRLYPKFDTVEAILQLVEAIQYIDKYHVDINSILIILHKPLLHFFYKPTDDRRHRNARDHQHRWTAQNACPLSTAGERTAYIKLLVALFDWKLKFINYSNVASHTRDCYLVTVVPIKVPKCVLFMKQDVSFVFEKEIETAQPGAGLTTNGVSGQGLTMPDSPANDSQSIPGPLFGSSPRSGDQREDDMSSAHEGVAGPVDSFSLGCIRQLLLPCHWNEKNEKTSFVFPGSDSIYPLGFGTNIAYEVNDLSYDVFNYGCECTSPRLDLHAHALQEFNEPLTYMFDVIPKNVGDDKVSSADVDPESPGPKEKDLRGNLSRSPVRRPRSFRPTDAANNKGKDKDNGSGSGLGTGNSNPNRLISRTGTALSRGAAGVDGVGPGGFTTSSLMELDEGVVMVNDADLEDSQSGYSPGGPSDEDSIQSFVTHGQFHLLIARTIINDYDHFDVILGPIVGFVTNTTAKVLIEVNRNLKHLKLVLRPRGTTGDVVEVKVDNVMAFELTTYYFTNLVPGLRYDILIPEIRNDMSKEKSDVPMAKGSFRTKTTDCLFVQLAFTGENAFSNEVEKINFAVRQLNLQQGFNLDLLAVQKHMTKYLTSHTPDSQVSSVSDNSWKWLSDHLNLPFTASCQIVHLGNISLIPLIMEKVTATLLAHASFLELPLDQASGISAFYFQQYDEVVKDTFRLFASIPAIQSTLSSGHHSPVFHSSYLLPHLVYEKANKNLPAYGEVELEDKSVSKFLNSGMQPPPPDKQLLLTRKVFEQNIQAYLMSLLLNTIPEEPKEPTEPKPKAAFGEEEVEEEVVEVIPDVNHYTKVWRYGTVVVIVFDIVSGRKKKKRKGPISSSMPEIPAHLLAAAVKASDGSAGEDSDASLETAPQHKPNRASSVAVGAPSAGPVGIKKPPKAGALSLGFLDKQQWQLLQRVLKDVAVTHLVLCAEKPFISLHQHPTMYGEFADMDDQRPALMHDWDPTVSDLTLFCDALIEWLTPDGVKPEVRNVALVGAADLPFTTMVRDVKTGLKIQQVCLGNFQYNADDPTTRRKRAALRETVDGFVLDGTIGRYKYWHSFGQMREILIDSSRTGDGGKDLVSAVKAKKSRVNSYFGSDSMFQQVREMHKRHGFGLLKFWVDSWKSTGTWSFQDENTAITPAGDAVLLVGPILGVLYKKTEKTQTPNVANPEIDAGADVVATTSNDTGMEPIPPPDGLWLPVLYEFDRPANVEICVRNIFSAAEMKFRYSFPGNRPVIVEIGPLEPGSRYTVNTLSGVRNSFSAMFVISTDYDPYDVNVVVLNCTKCKKDPCADFVQDVVDRCSIPFHGITLVLHVNVKIFSDTLLDELLDIPNLETAVIESRRFGAMLPACRQILGVVMETIRQDLRNVLSRPSYRQMLRSSFNLFMPTTHYTDTLTVNENNNTESLTRLLRLMVTRVSQEYLEQLRYPGDNIFKMKQSHVHLPSLNPISPSRIATANDYKPMSGSGVRPMSGVEASEAATSVSKLKLGSALNFMVGGVQAMGSSVSSALSGLSAKSSKISLTGSKPSTAGSAGGDTGSNSRPKTGEKIKKKKTDSDSDSDDEGTVEQYDIYISPSDADSVDAIYEQWLSGMEACPVDWVPWVSVNETTTIEIIRSPNHKNLATIYHELDNCVIDKGTRIMILDEGVREQIPQTAMPKPGIAGSYAVKTPGKPNSGLTTANMNISRSTVNTLSTRGSAAGTASASTGTATTLKNSRTSPMMAPPNTSLNVMHSDFEDLFNEESTVGFKFQKRLQKWSHQRPDRSLVLICPSTKYGTVSKILARTPNGASVEIHMLDSVFRSNRVMLESMTRQKESSLAAVKGPGGGASKRIQEKRKEEERLRVEKAKKEFQDLARSQPLDGYLIVESRMDTVTLPDSLLGGDIEPSEAKKRKKYGEKVQKKVHHLCKSNARRLGSVLPGEEDEIKLSDEKAPLSEFYERPPSNLDYAVLPHWLKSFSPGTDGVFIQDDVLLVMRQDPDTKAVADSIEGDEIFMKILQQYEKSRLSDLSRPPELREVDMSLPGVLEVFVKDIVERIWAEVVPSALKPRMVNICDDFIRSYCLSRCLTLEGPYMQALSSGEQFAVAMQKALVLATTLKTCFKMKDQEKFKYVLNYPEQTPFNMGPTESDLLKLHHRRFDWQDEKEEKERKAREAAGPTGYGTRESENKYEPESDMEELEAEEAEVERKQQEEEERLEREEEERQAAEEAAEEKRRLGVEDEEEKKVVEINEDDFEFDEDGNRKASKVVPVAAFKAEEEKPRDDIVGGGTGELEKKVEEKLLGYDELNDEQLHLASKTIMAAKIKHKVLTRRAMKDRLVFLQTK